MEKGQNPIHDEGSTGDLKEFKSPTQLSDQIVHLHGDHVDAAAAFLETHAGAEGPITAEEEARLVRKIDLQLIPIMVFAYMLNHTDKTVFGGAALFGILQSTQTVQLVNGKANTQRFSYASMIFFCGYIFGAYVLGAIAQRFPLGKCCSIFVIIWGVVFMLTVTCNSYAGIMVQRLFLGFMEGGIAPSFMLITGMWYKKEEQGRRTSWWYSSVGLAGIFPPVINYGVLKATQSWGEHQWKVIYYTWGAITIFCGFLCLWILPDSQLRAKFLNDRERYVAIERLRDDQTGVKATFQWYQVKEWLLDYKNHVLFLATFAEFSINGLAIGFNPLVLNSLGFNKYITTILGLVSGGIAFGIIIVNSWFVGRWPNRRIIFSLFCLLPPIVSFAMLWKLPQHPIGPRLFGIWFLLIFACVYGNIMSLAISNNAGYTKKLLVSAQIFVGYCAGNIAAPLYFKGNEAPTYNSAMIAILICTICAFFLLGLYGLLCMRENRRRNKMGAVAHVDRFGHDLTDRENPTFRYNF